jgi:hypothetical protein
MVPTSGVEAEPWTDGIECGDAFSVRSVSRLPEEDVDDHPYRDL